MQISVKFIKEIPEEQIRRFEDRVVYNTAAYTREYTKASSSYPYLTGRLARTEASTPIEKMGTLSYGLSAGVDYAKYVWNMDNVNWTNTATEPKWYFNNFKNHANTIVNQAVMTASREV